MTRLYGGHGSAGSGHTHTVRATTGPYGDRPFEHFEERDTDDEDMYGPDGPDRAAHRVSRPPRGARWGILVRPRPR
ncbi:hypothetical protein B1H18_17435 [Streptomyces tsukubensis]|uniref:Uncharacterized protein n=1 Tax=Streptomyces tsukubensis TaxID=83656 RepID=A0A1V4A8B7_9ACTN|nr:hypothetical protein B1H18_17435 [Streptomyces tsukubensis]